VILRLHFAEGLNLDRLAVALGHSRATAGRRVQSARARLRDGTMRLLEGSLEASRQEIESVLAALRSRLEVSLSALVTAA
jgi:RNA polymerase sigma-70 factor (ECF subfamily)